MQLPDKLFDDCVRLLCDVLPPVFLPVSSFLSVLSSIRLYADVFPDGYRGLFLFLCGTFVLFPYLFVALRRETSMQMVEVEVGSVDRVCLWHVSPLVRQDTFICMKCVSRFFRGARNSC